MISTATAMPFRMTFTALVEDIVVTTTTHVVLNMVVIIGILY